MSENIRQKKTKNPLNILMRLLNPQSGYIKIDAYLPQILCHVTSDVRLSQCFLLIKYRHVINTQIIQKTI